MRLRATREKKRNYSPSMRDMYSTDQAGSGRSRRRIQLVTEQISILEHALQNERGRLVGLCARITGDVDAAEDLAQETLLEAWRNVHKVHDPSGYGAWLSAIARNVCLRWRHKQGRQERHLSGPALHR